MDTRKLKTVSKMIFINISPHGWRRLKAKGSQRCVPLVYKHELQSIQDRRDYRHYMIVDRNLLINRL